MKVFVELHDYLNTLVDRLVKAELEDFGLDPSADYSDVTCEGKFNKEAAIQLLSVYEVRPPSFRIICK